MKHSRREFLKSAILGGAALGLNRPFTALAADPPAAAVPAGVVPGASAPAWQAAKGILSTPWTAEVTPEKVWPEYPRPQMVRDRWLNLNGLWDYQVTKREEVRLPNQYAGQILVPFGIESPLSGVMKPLGPDERLWYRRELRVPAEWTGQRVLLHFGAVDWEATIYLNGETLGSHRGGYDGFSFDVTNHVKAGESHQLVVSVWDPTDTGWQLHGKQTLHPGGCSYTATSGIWQTVWLEPVPESYVERLVLVPDLPRGVLKVTIDARIVPLPHTVRVTALDQGKPVADLTGTIGRELTPAIRRNMVTFFKANNAWVSTTLELPLPHAKAWSPDSPFLYDLLVQLEDPQGHDVDAVRGYFGMRSVGTGKDASGHTRPLLNGEPVLLCGALDQGFWPDGVYLAPTDAALRFDIEWAKKLGLNAVRKHVKVEPDRWYYWADKLGLLVLQDMPTGNCGDAQTDRPSSPEAADQWRVEVGHLIEDLGNHPSIVCWDLFNEAFGGFDYLRNVAWARQLDPSRLLNESSGFPFHGGGDVRDGHGGLDDDFKDSIQLLSESGTPSMGCGGHEWPHAWSYGSYDPTTGKSMDFLTFYNKSPGTAKLPDLTPEAKRWLTKEVGNFYTNYLRESKESGRSGLFYCQIVDTETECDGLMSYDRIVAKVDPEPVLAAIQASTPKITLAARVSQNRGFVR